MTWRVPEESWIDRLLKRMGRRRAVFVTHGGVFQERLAPYGQHLMVKESWFRALMRPKGAPLPPGSRDLYELLEELKPLRGHNPGNPDESQR